MSEISDTLARISTILIGFSRDMWMYISRGILKLRVVSGEVGSSTMPHKVNPIDFENAEGNLGISIALWQHFSTKLLISRLQRDLSDSTVIRNFGVSIGHFLISLDSLQKGTSKIAVNESACTAELNSNWGILAEPIQTIMRNSGIEKPYEKLKELTRGHDIGEKEIRSFISGLKESISDEEYLILENLTPQTYIGLAVEICHQYGV
jgi:adenylosuccinate lyase